jgi:ribosomal protein S18 acetylase RimI-like enzyme
MTDDAASGGSLEEISPWTIEDVDDVARALNAASLYDQFSIDQIREAVFDDPDLDPNLLLCRRVDGEIAAVIAAVVRRGTTADSERKSFVKLIGVAPRWQRRGWGTRLLAEVERRLATRGVRVVRVFADSPSHLLPGVDYRLTSLVSLLDRHGYEPEWPAVNMGADLTRAPLETSDEEKRLISAEVQISRLALDEAEAFQVYLASQWHWEWQIEPMRSLRRDPVSCFVATIQGEFVGFAAYDIGGAGSFGPMGVRSDLRRHGIGGVLLKRCLADMRDKGYATADIQWVGPISFYARQVGARISRCFLQMAKRLELAGES